MANKKSLPVREKLKIVEKELKSLQSKCEKAGYDPDKVRKVADPVIKAARRGIFKRTAKTTAFVFLTLAIFWGALYIEQVKWGVQVLYKKSMVNFVLPYYDWTWLYLSDCAWENPFYDPPVEKFSAEDCVPCANLKTVKVTYNAAEQEMTDKLYKGVPCIIGDDMVDWRTKTQNATLHTFLKMYATDEKIISKDKDGKNKTTYFRTTKDLKEGINNSIALSQWALDELQNGGNPEFHVYWGNNHIDSFKALHEWYTKPYFLPPMCEPIRHRSYIMMARRGESKGKGLMLRPRFGELGIWIGQVSGKFEFILQPIEDCKPMCKNQRFILEEGQMLNVPSSIFQISYRPNSTEAVAIAVGYEFS